MDVPFFDLTRQYALLRDELLPALDRVASGGVFVLGDEVAAFEDEFAKANEVRHCVSVNTGTSALHLAALLAGLGPGDEVITTANTFIASSWGTHYVGATPVFVDIDPATANLDPALVAAAITPRTKAILPVHLYGRPAALEPLLALAAQHGLALIEDAAQAQGARYRAKPVGGLGRMGIFSFYPTKNLGAYGEGGALVTDDPDLAERARRLRDHGQSARYIHDSTGFNYRLDALQAAILRIKLPRLPGWIARRRTIAGTYRRMLSDTRLRLLADAPGTDCAYHQFVIYAEDRDRLRDQLAAAGVQTMVHYPEPLHLQPVFRRLGYAPGSLPNTERACREAISLPLFPELTDAEVEYVGRTVASLAGAA